MKTTLIILFFILCTGAPTFYQFTTKSGVFCEIPKKNLNRENGKIHSKTTRFKKSYSFFHAFPIPIGFKGFEGALFQMSFFEQNLAFQAEAFSRSNPPEKGFAPIVVRVMNRGTNILMTCSFLFILIYSVYVAIAVSFGAADARSFVQIFWGAGIALAGGALAKIYYAFLS